MLMKKITPTSEDYIKAIFVLQQRHSIVRIKDIAAALSVKRPSVVVAIRSLVDLKIVNHERYGLVELTAHGLNMAQAIQRRHNVIFLFLHEMLGLNAENADQEACRIEHYVSQESLERIARLADFIHALPPHRHMEMEKMLNKANT